MHLQTETEWTYWCTWRPWFREFGDALGDWDRVISEMHLEAGIERVWRCTWRPWSWELAGHNRASLEIHLEAVIEWVCRCTWRPWSSEFGDALGGRDQLSLEMHLEAVIERVWWYTWRAWSSHIGLVLGGGRWTASRHSIHQLVNSQPWECDKVTLHFKLVCRTGWWRSIGREVHRKLNLHTGVYSTWWEWREDRQS